DDSAVLAETHTGKLFKRGSLGVIDDLIIEFPPDHEIDRGVVPERVLRIHGDRRTHNGDFQLGVSIFHHLRHLDVDVKAWRRGKQHQQLELAGHLYGLFDGNLVRWRVHHLAVRKKPCRIAEPHRVPVRFDLARSRPARTGTSIKTFKGWRIQKQCSHSLSPEQPQSSSKNWILVRYQPRSARYCASASAESARFWLSSEKLLNSMFSSAFPTRRVSTTL